MSQNKSGAAAFAPAALPGPRGEALGESGGPNSFHSPSRLPLSLALAAYAIRTPPLGLAPNQLPGSRAPDPVLFYELTSRFTLSTRRRPSSKAPAPGGRSRRQLGVGCTTGAQPAKAAAQNRQAPAEAAHEWQQVFAAGANQRRVT